MYSYLLYHTKSYCIRQQLRTPIGGHRLVHQSDNPASASRNPLLLQPTQCCVPSNDLTVPRLPAAAVVGVGRYPFPRTGSSTFPIGHPIVIGLISRCISLLAGKGGYELQGRTWRGFRHHMAVVLLTQAFVVDQRLATGVEHGLSPARKNKFTVVL